MGITTKIDITPADLKTIQALLKRFIPQAAVWAFGSRVKFTNKPNSDLDLVAFTTKDQAINVSLLKDAIEEAMLPFRVDLLCWDEIPDSFKKNIEQQYMIVQQTDTRENSLPKGWKTYKLEDLAETRKEQVASNGIEQPYIGLEHIEQQGLRLNGIGSSNDVVSNKFKFYNGDILYGRLRPYFRKVYKPRFDGVCSTEIFVILPKKIVDKNYLFYLIATEEFTSIANSGSSGTHMPRADWKQLEKSEWNIPDLKIQTQIASILSSLDDKIELNLQMNQTLETMAQAIFKEWFVNFNFPSFDGELVDGLPKGWRRGKVSEMCKVNANTLNAKDQIEQIHYIEISEVERGIIKSIAIYNRGEEPSRAKRKLIHGDVALSTVRPNRGSYFLALHPQNNLIASTGFAVFTATSVPYSFLYCFLTSDEQIEFYGRMADGAAYPAINPAIIMNIDFPIPSDSILGLYNDVAEKLYLKIHENLKENQTLTQLRDSLLPRLMSGKIEVKS